ncbi:MAG: peptidoglycan bridge formation glycyltransferase FemA/FemB family protein [Anaerolineales bacterium]|nr:peptidoglycan bridge formation glycyltransferase FemA/FemB family protein [Anaerolineales bacterium]
MKVLTKSEWDQFLEGFPDAHILQTSEWGELKSQFGWDVERLVSGGVGAQVLFQTLPMGFQIGYLPRGPLFSSESTWKTQKWDEFLDGLDQICQERRAILLKMEPDLWESEVDPEQVPPSGFKPSSHAIQPPRTIVVSLQEEEDEILMRMKSKTRYNARLARRKEVVVRTSSDLEGFYQLLETTADRADFGIHSLSYYQRMFELFAPKGACQLFVAEYKEQPLASIMVFTRGKRAWYFYGASSPEHRDRMPTYLVQWEAMRWAKSVGCDSYDLWGVPDAEEEELEEHFLERNRGLWGVYRFKRGFGGEVKRTLGPWDRVYQPMLYMLYKLWAKRKA